MLHLGFDVSERIRSPELASWMLWLPSMMFWYGSIYLVLLIDLMRRCDALCQRHMVWRHVLSRAEWSENRAAAVAFQQSFDS